MLKPEEEFYLLPCPLCDATPILIEMHGFDSSYVECQTEGCGLDGPQRNCNQEAVDVWNKLASFKIEAEEEKKTFLAWKMFHGLG